MEHPNLIDRNNAVEWAKTVFANKDRYLILDTETTGLGDKDVVVQIGIVDLDGNILIDTLVRTEPPKSISRDATGIHGIKSKDLKNAPRFGDILLDVMPYIKSEKYFLIYNFGFDARLINQTFLHEGLRGSFNIKGDCIMNIYSRFKGEWNPFYNDYKRQRLPEGTHNAVGDCLAALNVIKMMAMQEIIPLPPGYKPPPEYKTVDIKKQAEKYTLWTCLFLLGVFVLFLLFLFNC